MSLDDGKLWQREIMMAANDIYFFDRTYQNSVHVELEP